MMTSLQLLIAILAVVLLQLGAVLLHWLWRHHKALAQLEGGSLAGSAPAAATAVPPPVPGWTGYRSLKVVQRVVEDPRGRICSFILEAADGQPLPPFAPGQFLTFRIELPSAEGRGAQTLTRCYSLSDAPRPDHYRVSIQREVAPAGSAWPPGQSSSWFHDQVQVGSVLQVRAPSGHFVLRKGADPVVLIAGGIGVTPMLSMLHWCVEHEPGREVWFYYGVRNAREAAFIPHLRALASRCPALHLRLCFSAPDPDERLATDYHHRGRVDVPLLRLDLPLRNFHYYLCGPSPMMETLVPALEAWGIPPERLHYEAFGPASVRRSTPVAAAAGTGTAASAPLAVTFAKSGRTLQWRPGAGTLLDLAHAQGIALDSGCRAGSCGTCQTTVRSGDVSYLQPSDFEPEAGSCLPCVCTPKTDLTLEA